MKSRFKKKAKVFDISIAAVAAILSVGVMIYAVFYFGLREAWPELVLNMFYIACLAMMWMYFFTIRITTEQFNYWSSLCVAMTVLLRDILFPPPTGFLLSTPYMSRPLSAAHPHAHLLLCPQRMEDLLEEQPMDDLYCRCAHCHTLQHRHLS